jgi:hypothetical protein
MGAITKLGALSVKSYLINIYNHLRHLVIQRTNEIKKNLINLEEFKDLSFYSYFGSRQEKYIKDIQKIISSIKNEEDNSKLEKHCQDKILEINSLPCLIDASGIYK